MDANQAETMATLEKGKARRGLSRGTIVLLLVVLLGACREISVPGRPARFTVEEILAKSENEGWSVLLKPTSEGPFEVGEIAETHAPGEPLLQSFHFEGNDYQFHYPGEDGFVIRAISLQTSGGALEILALKRTVSSEQ